MLNAAITPVFNVKWSFRYHSNMLICCLRNYSYYYLHYYYTFVWDTDLNDKVRHFLLFNLYKQKYAMIQWLNMSSALTLLTCPFYCIFAKICKFICISSHDIIQRSHIDITAVFNVLQEPMVKFLLKEVQSTRTQRPTAGSSYPYVEIMLGDLMSQRITQLQLDQVWTLEYMIANHHIM